MVENNHHSTQRGAALVVSLVMLTILTILGLTSMKTTVLEQKMTSNERNQAIAFQAAETALRDAETIIDQDIEYLLGFGDRIGHYQDASSEPDILEPLSWTDENTRNATSNVAATDPARLIIVNSGQYLGEGSLNASLGGYDQSGTVTEPPTYFKVTTRGVGADGTSTIILQTYVADRLQSN